MTVNKLIHASVSLRDDMEHYAKQLVLEGVVDCVYNPLMYAWAVHKAFLQLVGTHTPKTILLGMNPGPHGMGQMGIPFAATSVVKTLFGISGIPVEQPQTPHPKRPVVGLKYPKEEVSGTRIWGLLKDHYGDAPTIFDNIFIVNHCPLMLFTGERAKNITPDKISGETTKAMLERCDEHLKEIIDILGAQSVIGVGRYSEKRAKLALQDREIHIQNCWHPSPASPLANKNGGADWRANVRSVLP